MSSPSLGNFFNDRDKYECRNPLADPTALLRNFIPKDQADLISYVYHCCPDINIQDAQSYVNQGTKLAEDLNNIANDISKSGCSDKIKEELWKEQIKSLATPQNAVCLMWHLTQKCAQNDNLYTEGAMIIHSNGNLSGKRIELFLRACGDTENEEYKEKVGYPAYTRISTHMPGRFKEEQWGLDLVNMNLPAQKNTLLFGTLDDGTLYLKMEDHGCPPALKQPIGSEEQKKMMPQFKGHVVDFAKTREGINKFVEKKGYIRPQARRENTPKDAVVLYKKALNEALKHNKIDKQTYKKYLACSDKGITTMNNILKSINHPLIQTKRHKTIDLTQLPKDNIAINTANLNTPPPTKTHKMITNAQTALSVAISRFSEIEKKAKGQDLQNDENINVVGMEVHVKI